MNYLFDYLKHAPETTRSKKKGSFYVSFLFLYWIRMFGSESGTEKCADPGSGIKHPGSATLAFLLFRMVEEVPVPGI
jgi:hypothetical protein